MGQSLNMDEARLFVLYWLEFFGCPMASDGLNILWAADEGLTLVPQLNIWGHASLSRVRTGNHATLDFAPEYEPLFEPYSGWNWCLSNPAARQVIKDLVVELHEAFGNPRYFHIGCDEGCPPTCPKCRAADYNELFSTLVREVVDMLASRGAEPVTPL